MMNDYEPSPEQKKYGPLFTMVQDKTNWKNPINAVVDTKVLTQMGATIEDLGRAVTFYAGCVAKVTRDRKNPSMIHVKAVGYYAAVGA